MVAAKGIDGTDEHAALEVVAPWLEVEVELAAIIGALAAGNRRTESAELARPGGARIVPCDLAAEGIEVVADEFAARGGLDESDLRRWAKERFESFARAANRGVATPALAGVVRAIRGPALNACGHHAQERAVTAGFTAVTSGESFNDALFERQ